MENIKNERKLRLTGVNFRRFLAGIGVGVTLMAMSGCAKKNDKVAIPENTIGYYDTLDKADENNFVIFDIQNSKEISPKEFTDLKEKITKAKDQGISVGIKLELSTKELQVYNDIDYIKTLIKEYGNEFIDFPVYVGIDSIVESDLSLKEKSDLITKILTILEENGMYVGLYGKDSNLCKLREGILLNYKDYDSCVVMESKQPEDIKYDGSFNLYMDKKGVIHSKAEYDLSDIIVNNYKNSEKKLKGNLVYEVQEGDKLKDLEEEYNISAKTILKYNNISKFKFKKGLKLEIPSVSKDISTGYEMGADLSGYNTTNWEQAERDNIKFCIFKSNFGLNKIESNFESNCEEAQKRNIPYGIYMFNSGYSPEDEPELQNGLENTPENFKTFVEQECDMFLNILDDKKIDLPVYLDIEDYIKRDADGNIVASYLVSNYSKEYVVILLSTFYDKVASYEKQKLVPGIYLNQSLYNDVIVPKLTEETDNKELDEKAMKLLDLYKNNVWIAGGEQYGDENTHEDDVEISEVVPSESMFAKYPNVNMIQSTNVAIDAFSKDGNGHLDVDFRKVPLEDIEIRIFEPKNNNSILPVVIIVTLIGGVVVATKVIKKKDLPKFRKDHPEVATTPVLTEDEFKQELGTLEPFSKNVENKKR